MNSLPVAIALPLLITLSGCMSTQEALRLTAELTPVSSTEFRYKAAGVGNDPLIEAARMDDIAARMRLNNLCQAGYEIADRQAIVRVIAPAGPAGETTYTIRCR